MLLLNIRVINVFNMLSNVSIILGHNGKKNKKTRSSRARTFNLIRKKDDFIGT